MLKVAVENCPEIAIIDAVRRAGPFDEGLHVFGYHLVEGFRLGRAATVGGGNAMGVCCWHAVAARKTETRGVLDYHVVLSREPWVFDHTDVCTRRHNAAADESSS